MILKYGNSAYISTIMCKNTVYRIKILAKLCQLNIQFIQNEAYNDSYIVSCG